MSAAVGPRWTAASWAALAGGGLLAVAVPAVGEGPLRWAPLLTSLLVLGMAHGAVDHHVPARLGARPRAVVASYAAAALVALAAFAAFPVAGFAAFLVLSAAHWGDGEGWYARHVHGRPAWRSPLAAGIWAAARGALPIGLAALAHPAEAREVAGLVVERFGAAAPGPFDAVPGLVAIVVLVAAATVVALRELRGRDLALELGELALLTAFFAAVPAVFAVGLYFLAWHSPRHVARLVDGRPGPALRALARFHREALPATAAALAGLAALAAATAATGDPGALAGAALALIAALTVPHALLVAWMDARQGVWRASGPTSRRRRRRRRARPSATRASARAGRRQSRAGRRSRPSPRGRWRRTPAPRW